MRMTVPSHLVRKESMKTDDPAAIAAMLSLPGTDWLHVGGTARKEGWKVLNIQPGEHVDYVGDVSDLSGFADQSFDVVYSSHTLEHLGYQRDLPRALAAIYRILRPGGKLFASVPDRPIPERTFFDNSSSRRRPMPHAHPE